MVQFPYSSYPYRGNDTRFGPLLPFVGGLLVGGLFAPRPNYSYGPFQSTPPMNMGPSMPSYPAPYYPGPVPAPYSPSVGPTPMRLIIWSKIFPPITLVLMRKTWIFTLPTKRLHLIDEALLQFL